MASPPSMAQSFPCRASCPRHGEQSPFLRAIRWPAPSLLSARKHGPSPPRSIRMPTRLSPTPFASRAMTLTSPPWISACLAPEFSRPSPCTRSLRETPSSFPPDRCIRSHGPQITPVAMPKSRFIATRMPIRRMAIHRLCPVSSNRQVPATNGVPIPRLRDRSFTFMPRLQTAQSATAVFQDARCGLMRSEISGFFPPSRRPVRTTPTSMNISASSTPARSRYSPDRIQSPSQPRWSEAATPPMNSPSTRGTAFSKAKATHMMRCRGSRPTGMATAS